MLGVKGSKNVPKENLKKSNTDNVLYKCPDCKKIWEYMIGGAGFMKNNVLYYNHIPTYGKSSKSCPSCRRRT
mgnify:CR=1 FL=1